MPIDDHPDLERRYRAPRAFGPMPGPRNIPASQRRVAGLPDEATTSLAVSLEADPVELSRLLPPYVRLSGAATLTVTATRFENLLWLAGRGYPILTVTIPVEHRGETPDTTVDGRYLAVLWEGLADPITTGRDELGFPKLPADIAAPRIDDVTADGAADAQASWDGFRFVDLTAEDLRTDSTAQPAPPKGTIVHRYVPSLVGPGTADIDQLVFHPIGGAHRPTVTHRLSGTGRFRFQHAEFADLPVQYPVINILADLALAETGPATLIRTTATPGSMASAVAPRILRSLVAHSHQVPAGALA